VIVAPPRGLYDKGCGSAVYGRGGLQRLDATTTGNRVIFAVVVEGLIEVIIGAVGVIVGVILRLPSVIHWMEEDIDARLPQHPVRKAHWLEGIVDWHYRTSRKRAPFIMRRSFSSLDSA